MLKGQTVLCISSIDWDFIWQGHQQIMSMLAAHGNNVLFIENIGARRLQKISRDSQDRVVDERTVKVNAWSSAEWTLTLPAAGALGPLGGGHGAHLLRGGRDRPPAGRPPGPGRAVRRPHRQRNSRRTANSTATPPACRPTSSSTGFAPAKNTRCDWSAAEAPRSP